MSHTQAICPQCQTPLKPGASEGLCPRCLLRGVLRVKRGSSAGASRGAEEIPIQVAPPLGRLGDYELLEKIAQGGMGAVYKARQLSLNRIVALKLILAGRLATDQEVRRFRTEAEAAAQLDHPNIVPIYEVGEADGRQFFAMKFVEGGSLAEWRLNTGSLNTDSLITDRRSEPVISNQYVSAALVARIARAVHHAHQRGVLHRDLKPGNILLDAQGQPHVTDFGLARLPERDSGVTLPGTVLGTPSFMAPEQAAGAAGELTTAADVYGLGAILYFLLTGRAPFTGATVMETLQKVMHEEPVPPSRCEVRGTRGEQAVRLDPRPSPLSPDLEAICLKCLEKEPARRYASALALAEDLERWERHEPIHARPATTWELTTKWMRRHPARAALVAVVLISGTALGVREWSNRLRLEGERNRAVAQEETTRLNLYSADVYLAAQALDSGNLGLARRALEAHVPETGRKDLRGFEWRHLWSRCQGDQLAILPGHNGAVSCVAFSADARFAVSGSDDRTVRLWDVERRAAHRTLDGFSDAVVAVAFSRDGGQLIAAMADQTVSVRDIETGRMIGGVRLDGTRIGLSPDGTRAALALSVYPPTGRENLVTLHDARSGTLAGTLRGATGWPAMSHDGRRVAAATASGFAIWDALELTALAAINDGEARAAFRFSRDDRLLLCLTGRGRSAGVWDTAAGTFIAEFVVPETRLHGGDFSPDGRLLATCGTDQSIHLWHLAARRKAGELKGHVNEVRAVAFAPDGRLLASAGKDGTVRLWRPEPGRETVFPTNTFPPCALSSDGRWLAAQDRLGRSPHVQVRLWDTTTWQAVPLANMSNAQPVAFLGTNGPLLSMTRPNQAELLILRRGDLCGADAASPVRLPDSDRPRTATDYSPRRELFALGSYDGSIQVWRAEEGAPLSTLRGPAGEVQALRFAPDGRTLASFTKGGGLKLWSVDEARELRSLAFSAARAFDLAFSSDGRTLAAADSNNGISLWNPAMGALLATLTGHAEPVWRVAFAPDGRTLASAGEDGAVKLWGVAARRELATVFRGEPKVWLEFSANGRALFGTGANGQLHVWAAP